MVTETMKLRSALLAVFLDSEQVAVNSHETCTYPGSVFNDRVWRKGDSSFAIYKTARLVLGLRPFIYRSKTTFGDARKVLTKFRATAHRGGHRS